MIFFALSFENFQSQQKEKMDLIEIRGFTNGIEQVGDYRVGYISGVELNPQKLIVTIYFHCTPISYKLNSIQEAADKFNEIQAAIVNYRNKK